jgi:alkylated DNA repair dioxygenase AlkB
MDGLPPGFTYLPGVFAPAAATAHLDALVAETPWEDHVFRLFGRTVPMPRRIAYYGAVPYGYSGLIHPARPFPPRIQALADAVAVATGHSFNTVLVNLYRDGRDGMSWHADDDYPPGRTAAIASVSFGGERRFDLRARGGARVIEGGGATAGERASIVLGHGSVLVMGEGTQAAWQHSVAKTTRPVGVRVNLTFRDMAPRG